MLGDPPTANPSCRKYCRDNYPRGSSARWQCMRSCNEVSAFPGEARGCPRDCGKYKVCHQGRCVPVSQVPSVRMASGVQRLQSNPPPLPMGRGGRLDYADQYAVFPPGYQPYGGYGGVGYAPQAPGVPVAYPVAPPGVYLQGQSCRDATDCARDEYCHMGACMPVPGLRNVGVTQTSSIGGVPVENPWPLTFPTKGFRRQSNPGAPMTQMTQSLAPAGFAVR